MKNFKLIPVLFTLSLCLLFSDNSLLVAYTDNYNLGWHYGKNMSDEENAICGRLYYDFYSKDKDNKFCVYESEWESGLVFVKNVSKSRNIFEFRNLISFSYSYDGKYLLVERSEYNDKIGLQNDFIEVFDLANEKRIFFMPFYKKCYPASSYYSIKSYDLDGLVYLNFYGNTLKSVEFDFEGDYIFVPANLYNVRSIYASQLGLGLSVKFNDGSMKVYIPNKDFSGINEVFSFGKSVLSSDLVCPTCY